MNDLDHGPFDEEAFMSQTTDQEGSTKVIPLPRGDYLATIEAIKPRPWKSEKTGKSGLSVDVTYAIIDDGNLLEAQIGRPPKTTQGYFCDLIEGTSQLDFSTGKNVQINRIRDACGQNIAGQAWNLGMLRGAGPISLVIVQDPDKDDPKTIYNRVKAVGRPQA
jgi:hypothetical protein